MIVFLRIFFALFSLQIGWLTVAEAIGIAVWWSWGKIANIRIFNFEVGSAPSIYHIELFVINSALALLLFVFFVSITTPLSIKLRQLLGKGAYTKVKDISEIYRLVETLARRNNVNMPKVYLYHSKQPGAFCISGMFSSVILVSDSLLYVMNADELAFVAAHEFSHLRHHDSFVNALWLSVSWVSGLFRKGEIYLTRTVWVMLSQFGMPVIFIYLLTSPLLILFYIGRFIEKISQFIFLLLDRQLCRWTEYRCDLEATHTVYPGYGITVMNKLLDGIEPSFNIFATHPSTRSRIAHLEKLCHVQHSSESNTA